MKAFETITVGGTAVALTANVFSICNKAMIVVEDTGIRYRVDGSSPTSTVGLLANVNDIITLQGASELKLFRAISTGGTDATLSCDYSSGRDY